MFEMMHAFFTWLGSGIGTVRLVGIVSPVPEIRSDGLPRLRSWNELARHDLHEQSRAAFLIGRSVHHAQLSVSFETVK